MPHRKQVKHYHEPGDLHELTFSTYHRRPLLTRDDWLSELSRKIDVAGQQEHCRLVAFVYMPEHVHVLIDPVVDRPRIYRYLQRIRRPFSSYVKRELEESNSSLIEQLTMQVRPSKWCFRFWQEGPGYDRNLNKPSSIRAAIDYLHENPVRRGLCVRAADWRWSSARWYLGDGQASDPTLPAIHGLRVGSFDDGHVR